MAQSQNTSVELQTTGVSYMGFGGKVGKFLVGDKALEFYPDSNVERYIQIPWSEMTSIGANVSGKAISRHFEISGKILKIAREHIGNEKVVKLPTLLQTIGRKISNLFAKK